MKCAIDYSAAGGTSPDTFEIAATGSMLIITQTKIPADYAILTQSSTEEKSPVTPPQQIGQSSYHILYYKDFDILGILPVPNGFKGPFIKR